MPNDTAPAAHTAALEEPGGRPIPTHPDGLLFTVEVGFLTGLSPRSIEALRLRGGGPVFIQVTPKAVRYRRRDLDAWLDARVRKSTSDPGPDEAGASA